MTLLLQKEGWKHTDQCNYSQVGHGLFHASARIRTSAVAGSHCSFFTGDAPASANPTGIAPVAEPAGLPPGAESTGKVIGVGAAIGAPRAVAGTDKLAGGPEETAAIVGAVVPTAGIAEGIGAELTSPRVPGLSAITGCKPVSMLCKTASLSEACTEVRSLSNPCSG